MMNIGILQTTAEFMNRIPIEFHSEINRVKCNVECSLIIVFNTIEYCVSLLHV